MYNISGINRPPSLKLWTGKLATPAEEKEVPIARKGVYRCAKNSLLEFCGLIDPKRQIFHAMALREIVAARPYRGPWLAIDVIDLIQSTYQEALTLHLAANQHGPVPRPITAELHSKPFPVLVIQYKNGCGDTFRLRLNYGLHGGNKAVFVFMSRDAAKVQKFASDNSFETLITWPDPKLGEFDQVKIPLGEIMDLVTKHSR